MKEKESLLIQFLGRNPLVKILDFLIEAAPFDHSKKEIGEGSGVSRAVLFKNWKRLEKFKLVKPTRKFGKTQLYVLNTKNELIQVLLELEKKLMKESWGIEEKKVPVEA